MLLGHTMDLSEFFESTVGRISTPTGKSWLEALLQERKNYFKAVHPPN